MNQTTTHNTLTSDIDSLLAKIEAYPNILGDVEVNEEIIKLMLSIGKSIESLKELKQAISERSA